MHVLGFCIHFSEKNIIYNKKVKKKSLHMLKKIKNFTLIPSKSSGDRYHNVTTMGVYGFNGSPNSRAKPKSPI